jgi:hypothetical protein
MLHKAAGQFERRAAAFFAKEIGPKLRFAGP